MGAESIFVFARTWYAKSAIEVNNKKAGYGVKQTIKTPKYDR
jgi:hypothetical protein